MRKWPLQFARLSDCTGDVLSEHEMAKRMFPVQCQVDIFLGILFHQNCRSTDMLTTKNNEWRWWPLHSCLRVGRGTLDRRWDCIFCIRNQNVKTFIPGNILSDVQIHFRMFQRKWVVAFAQLSGCFGGVTIFHDAIENLTVDTCVHIWEGFDFSDESN